MLQPNPDHRPTAAVARTVLAHVSEGREPPRGWEPVREEEPSKSPPGGPLAVLRGHPRAVTTGSAVLALAAVTYLMWQTLVPDGRTEEARPPSARGAALSPGPASPSPSSPSPTRSSPTTPRKSPNLDACFDGKCRITVREDTEIPLDGRHGIDTLTIVGVNPNNVSVYGEGDNGTTTAGGSTYPGSTMRIANGLTMRVISAGEEKAKIALSPA
ncbi:MAG: hypothetical protein GEV03_20760 [Streptosporangiales bacterium]|nr:hypothetical protein [Streptosporangiales bacterium]